MKKKSIELLREQLLSSELCILDMHELINRKFIQKNYKAEVETLEILIRYFKTGKEEELSAIWGDESLQKTIFLFCVEIWKCYEEKEELTEKDLERILEEKIENTFIKTLLIDMYQDISKLCIHSTEASLNDIYFYEDDILKITNVNMETFPKVKKYFSGNDVFFHIITEGIVSINKTLIFKGEGYCTETEPILDEIKNITNNYSAIIVGIKKEFMSKLNLNFTKEYRKKFSVYSLEVFSLILRKEKITKENYFHLYQLITYLSQVVKGKRVELFRIPYLEYKADIIKIIEESILEEEREIIDKICKTVKVSLPTVYKIFNSLFKETPTKYIERRKMNYTCYYLCNTNESIEKIGEKVGYSRRLYSKKFLEFSGYMPTEFRKMMV